MAFTVRKRTAYGCFGCAAVLGLGSVALVGVGGVGAFLGPGWAWEQSVRAALGGLTEGEATFDSIEMRDDGVIVWGLSLSHPDGTRVLWVDRVDVACDPLTLATDDWVLNEVAVEGVRVELNELEGGLALPPATWELIWGEGVQTRVPHVVIDRVRVVDSSFLGAGHSGSLAAKVETVEIHGFELMVGSERPLRLREAVFEQVASSVDGRELVGVGLLTLDADGVFTGSAIRGSVSIQESGWPVWPPLVELWIPTWAGGRGAPVEGEPEPYWGWRPDRWVWVPERGSLDGRLALTDGWIAARAKTWVLTGVEASVGPAKRTLPFAVRAYTAGGPVRVGGRLEPNGRVSTRVTGTGLEASEFSSYLAVDLAKLGVEIREGKLDAQLDVSLLGSRLSSQGVVSLTEVRFNRTSIFSGLNKAMLTTASWLLGGKDKRFSADVGVNGDFQDRSFSPFRQIFGQVSAAIVKDARDRVGKGVKTVTEGTGKLWKKVFKAP